MNEENEHIPEEQTEAEINAVDDVDLRYAPPLDDEIDDEAQDAVESDVDTDDGSDDLVGSDDEDHMESVVVDADDAQPSTRKATGELDVEAALAAISRLTEEHPKVSAEPEAEPEPEAAPYYIEYPMPPPMTLRRGSMSSLVPGVLMVLIGAWLTYALNADSAPSGEQVTLVVTAAMMITFFAQWMSSRRWSVGTLLFALLLLLCTGITFILTQTETMDFSEGWPLYVGALGLTLVLVSVFTRALARRPILTGLALIVASIAGLAVTTEALPDDIIDVAESLWPVAIVIAVILWVVPVLTRRRGKRAHRH